MRTHTTTSGFLLVFLLVTGAALAQSSVPTAPPPTPFAPAPTPTPFAPVGTYAPAPAPAYAPTPASAVPPAPFPPPAPALPPAPVLPPAPASLPAPATAPAYGPGPGPIPAAVATPAIAPTGPLSPSVGATPGSPAVAAPTSEAEGPSPSAPIAAVPASETEERAVGFLPQLSLGGGVGLLHMSSAEVGSVGQLRLGLHGEFFSSSNVLVQKDNPPASDHDTRLQGALTFGVTAARNLEIFGAVLGSANRNRRCFGLDPTGQGLCVREANSTDPELIKSFGDLILGAKLAYPVGPGFSAGGEVGIRMMSSITGISFSPDSTSLWVNALATYDLKPELKTVPLRFHLNLGYYVDNSGNLTDYNSNNTSAFSRYVSKFAYGISESRFRVALGADAPFDEVTEGFSLRPIAEYHLEYLTGSADSVIYNQEHTTCGAGVACKDNKDQHWVTLGVQGQVLRGLTFTVGLDIALRSAGFPYAPALAPWNLLFGFGYPVDLVPRVVVRNVPIEKIVKVEDSLREGLVAGRVVSTAGTPVEGAIVGVTGRQHSRVLTDADGTFQSVPLVPGPVELVLVANGFETTSAKTDVIAGQTANVVFTLTPRASTVRAVGHITDGSGKGVAAALKLAGPQIAEGKSDESGNFAVPVLPGQYALRIDADQYLSKEVQLAVAEGKESPASITLRFRPAVAGVTFQGGKFKLRQPVAFKSGGKQPSLELTSGALHLLDEVVDILVNHPEIGRVRVEAHWDSSLSVADAQELTDAQAKTIAKYLVDQGVGPERVVSVGMGSKKPMVPNLGATGKSKNRRIEFIAVP